MPSTNSVAISVDCDSSTVTTPSLPTRSKTLAIKSPISLSLAEIEATSFKFDLVIFWDLFSRELTTHSTALSMPRFKTKGLAPALTAEKPSATMAWARTVAVVVPSPATSFVLEATSCIRLAPIFSNSSLSSIYLATVTPSLVITGEPKPLSKTTFRPFGPSVTLTAFAILSTPRLSDSRASFLYSICFAIISDTNYELHANDTNKYSRTIRVIRVHLCIGVELIYNCQYVFVFND